MIWFKASMSGPAVTLWAKTMSDCVIASLWICPGCCVARTREIPGCLPSLSNCTSASVAGVLPSFGRNSCASSMNIQTSGESLLVL